MFDNDVTPAAPGEVADQTVSASSMASHPKLDEILSYINALPDTAQLDELEHAVKGRGRELRKIELKQRRKEAAKNFRKDDGVAWTDRRGQRSEGIVLKAGYNTLVLVQNNGSHVAKNVDPVRLTKLS